MPHGLYVGGLSLIWHEAQFHSAGIGGIGGPRMSATPPYAVNQGATASPCLVADVAGMFFIH